MAEGGSRHEHSVPPTKEKIVPSLFAEYHSEWTPKQLEKRHHNVARIIGLESAAREGGRALYDFLEQLGKSELSKKRLQQFVKIAIRYHSACSEAEQSERYYRGPENKDDAALGREFFRLRLDTDPSGEVRALRQEGYFILYCSDPTDYQLFCHLEKPDDYKNTGGTFHRAMQLGTAANPISLLLINNPRHNDSNAAVVAHERQHWINHQLLEVFTETETRNLRPDIAITSEITPEFRQELSERNLEAEIKDEILAFLRDGTPGWAISANLSNDCYEHLFVQHKEQNMETVQQIEIALTAHEKTALSHESRPALIAQLFDVPFRAMPKMIETISEFYSIRFANVDSCRMDEDSQDKIEAVAFDIYPIDLAQFHLALTTSLDAYRETWNRAVDAVYGSNGEYVDSQNLFIIGNDLKRASEAVQSAHRTLLKQSIRNGVHVPTLRVVQSKRLDARDHDWEQVSAGAEARVLAIAEILPKSLVSNAYRDIVLFEVDYGGRRLAAQFKKILDRETGFDHQVDIENVLREPRQIIVSVVQRETDLYPEVTYRVFLHRE